MTAVILCHSSTDRHPSGAPQGQKAVPLQEVTVSQAVLRLLCGRPAVRRLQLLVLQQHSSEQVRVQLHARLDMSSQYAP